MRIEYTYEAGCSWSAVVFDILDLIAHGAAALPRVQTGAGVAALCSVVGEPAANSWAWDGAYLTLPAIDGGPVSMWLPQWATTKAADVGLMFAAEYSEASGYDNPEPVHAVICGQNSANDGNTSERGTVRIAVAARAAVISFPYGAGRQLALLGEAGGDYFGEGQYPRHFVMSSQAAVSGAWLDAVVRVPYFPRVKNPEAAGDKTGLAACGLAFAVGISATNGWVYGVNESLVYQGLPLDVFSSPKAAHLGYVRDVILAPCKNVANDDYLVIGGEQYIVFRENGADALALAVKA